MTTIIDILAIAICVFIQGFFSGAEMVLLSSNKFKLRQNKSKDAKTSKLIFDIFHNQRWYLATTTTGTNLLVIIASVIAAAWFEHHFGNAGELLAIIFIAPILLIFGEIIPRTIFQQKATELAPKIAYYIYIASRIISPFTFLVFWISRFFYGRVEKENLGRHPLITREELELMLNSPAEESDVKRTEKKLIRRVFHLSKLNVEDIMVPLVNMIAISHTLTVKDTTKIIGETGYSRLPVYQGRIDNLIGIIHAFDLINVPDSQLPVSRFIREVPFVPEFKRADDLLVSLQKARMSIAIVVNEYGGAVGIITIEDILEEVVGEIRDEYDREVSRFVRIDSKRFMVSARMEIESVNERLKINLPKEDYETVGGFLLKHMGKIPIKGEIFTYKTIKFTIQKASKRAIYDIIIEIPEMDNPMNSLISGEAGNI